MKNSTDHFFNDTINIKVFDSNLLQIDKKSYKNIDIYYIGYITTKKIDDYENIYSVNILYRLGEVDQHIEERNGSKYLIFDSTDGNKEIFKKYIEVWDGIKNEIETIHGSKEGEYGKDFMKIKFNTDNNLPLNKPLKFPTLTIIVRCVFQENEKLYPQIYLDECLYEFYECK